MQRKVGRLKRIISLCLVLMLVLCSSSHSALASGDDSAQTVQTTSESETTDTAETGTTETEGSSSQDSEEQTQDMEQSSTNASSESTSDMEGESTEESMEESGDESGESETEDDSESDEEQIVVFDTQPTTLEEVQNAIDTYNAAFEGAMASGGWEAAALVKKPHWEFEVAEELMPSSYSCQLVDDDEEFGADYYTFFAKAVSVSTAWDGSIATSLSGSGTAISPYLIYTAAELAFVAQQVNAGVSGYAAAEYKLMDDINLNGLAWTPIGIGGGVNDATGSNNTLDAETAIGSNRTTYAFKGVFDGNGKTITGLTKFVTRPTATGSSGNVARGFFGAIESAEIKNLTIDGAAISETGGATGILVGFAVNDVSGTGGNISITGCSITNSTLTSTRTTYQRLGIGALVGYMVIEDADAVVKIEDCTVSNTTVTSSTTAFYGGVAAGIGYVRNIGTSTSSSSINGKLVITNCNLTNTTVNSITDYSGGMVGYVYMHYNKGLTLEMNNVKTSDLTINRNTTALYNFGGLVGYFYSLNSGDNKFIVNSVNMTDTNINASNYTNEYSGGVIGQWYSANSSNDICDIDNITLSGMTIKMTGTSSTGYIGGVAGRWYSYQSSNNSCSISNVKASNLTFNTSGSSSGNIGGVIGQWYSYRDASAAAYNDDNNTFEVKDVAMDALSISVAASSYYTGGIAGCFLTHYSGKSSGSIENCDVKNSTIQSSGTGSYRKGGIIGNVEVTCSKNSSFHIAYCDTDCELISNGTAGYSSGGIVGHYNILGTSAVTTDNFDGSITNCNTKGEIQGNNTTNYYYGGVAGYLILGTFTNGSKMLVENCSATGDVISQSYYIGGLIGYIENTSDSGTRANPTKTIVRNCYATGTVNAGAGSGDGTNAGGLLGHIHAGTNLPEDTVLIENCYAAGDVFITSTNTATAFNVGGFVGRPTKNVTIRDSYATGDVYCAGIHVGGFAGYIEGEWSTTADNHVTIENSYSTGNVIGGYYNVGGFAGNMLWGYLKNCYSIGSVYSTYTSNSYVGGFLGWVQTYGGKITNCYSTGYVASAYTGAGSQIGGFIGRIEALGHASTGLVITDSFFDSTTSGMNSSFGYTGTNTYLSVIYSGSSVSSKQVTALSTSDMIDASTFSAWSIVNNVYAPNSKGNQTPESPWYIDDEITYPYLYFQADGFNTDKGSNGYLNRSSTGDGYQNNITITPYQTTYNLSVLNNSANNWSTTETVTHKRADYTTADLAGTSVQYQAVTAGAERAYFPYIYGKSYSTYNNSEYKWYFDSSGKVYIPSSGTYSHTSGTLYSLGSISRTDIVAFENGPYTSKSSNRPVWDEGDTDTYTYVAEEYEYEIEVANYSTTGAFKNVVVTDPLPIGVSIVNGSVKISWDGGAAYTDIPYYDGISTAPTTTPYYTYELDSSGNYSGRYIFTVYLGDFAKAEYSNSNLLFDQCFIQYTAYISREAATDFTQSDWRTFENIRNKAYVTGTMVYDSSSTDVSLVADDENTDPVYDRYWVAYNDNLDADETSQNTDTEKIIDYYLTDGSQQHTVLDPSDSTLSFTRPGYEFTGWAEVDENGDVIHTYSLDDMFFVTHDTILYAQWEKIAAFEFYKVSAVSDSTMLQGAKFKLFEYTGSGVPNGLIDTSTPGADWTLVGNEVTTGDDGKVSFELANAADGKYYQLIETEAPDNFKLPTGQWLIKVNINSSTGELTYDITKVDGADGAAPPAFKTLTSGELLLTNIPYNGLPAMGGNGTAIYLLIGMAFVSVSVLIGVIKVSALRRRRRMRFTNRI